MKTSEIMFGKAKELIPGGVNSPVRAFNSVGGTPVYMKQGKGSRMYDVDDKEYIDFCGSWGPLILGHADKDVVDAVKESSELGLSFGTCNPREIELAEVITKAVPYMEKVRAVNSGTEATMTALRLARGYTGKNKILKFDGCYHGHADSLLVSAGSGLLTGGISSSAGVSNTAVEDMIVAPYNDIAAVEEVFANNHSDMAAVIVEPVAGNMGLIRPADGFLEKLRELTQKYGVVLILDEVITGFRLCPSTYGVFAGITPDLTCLGKIIGGGMPIGALGGKAEIMDHLAPLGPVYQAGTLSGNPVALSAGIATIKKLVAENPYPELEKKASRIADAVNAKCEDAGRDAHVACYGGLFTLFFTGNRDITNIDDVKKCDMERFAKYYHFMLDAGFYLSPSQYELNFVSAAHTDDDIDKFIGTIKRFIDEL